MDGAAALLGRHGKRLIAAGAAAYVIGAAASLYPVIIAGFVAAMAGATMLVVSRVMSRGGEPKDPDRFAEDLVDTLTAYDIDYTKADIRNAVREYEHGDVGDGRER